MSCPLETPNDPRMVAVAIVICVFCLVVAIMLRKLRA